MKTLSGRILFLFISLLIFVDRTKAQVPVLNSDLSAAATIFLDFDGQYVTGTSWNWSGAINAQPSGLSREAVVEIFNRVAEDYRPFNLNITTDSLIYAAAPTNKRTRLIVTPSSEWYGRAGGVAFVGSFNWGNDTPAWVFSALLNNNVKNVAEACSHEAGHTLGLQHQSSFDVNCNKVAEYSAGRGEGEIGWAPIMGVGYHKNLTTWSSGPSTAGCNNIQDDLSVIAGPANNFGFRADDHGDNPTTSTPVDLQSQSFLVNGLINRAADIDAFKIDLPFPTVLKLNAIPQNVGNGNQGANIDIRVSILNAAKDTIGVYNPSTLLNAGIDTNLNTGSYYIIVKGIGNINQSEYGSLGSYSINGSVESILPVHGVVLKGKSTLNDHILSWTYTGHEKSKSFVVESSSDGKTFQALVNLSGEVTNFTYRPFHATSYYRVKITTTGTAGAYYSNVISLKLHRERGLELLSSIVHDRITIRSNGAHAYQVFDNNGTILHHGKFVSGLNHIDVRNAANGILFLRMNNGVDLWTEKLIKQ